jgi:predicted Fe-Mo cluster-binding NifX family protein
MNVAIPIYEDTVSPRFDLATELLIMTLENSKVQSEKRISIQGLYPLHILKTIIEEKINVVLCGAVNGFCLRFLGCNGIEVIPGLVGKIDAIKDGYLKGELQPEMFFWGWRGRGRGRRRSGGCPRF